MSAAPGGARTIDPAASAASVDCFAGSRGRFWPALQGQAAMAEYTVRSVIAVYRTVATGHRARTGRRAGRVPAHTGPSVHVSHCVHHHRAEHHMPSGVATCAWGCSAWPAWSSPVVAAAVAGRAGEILAAVTAGRTGGFGKVRLQSGDNGRLVLKLLTQAG